MSFPNIPDVNPAIDVNRDEVINLLLASIAFEELGLAHVINAEGEKIQFVLGTLPGQTPPVLPTIDELLDINRSVEQTLRDVIKTQILLQFKLEDVLEIPRETTTTTSTTTTTTTTQSTTTTTTESTTTTTESTTTTTTESTTTTTESTTTTTESTTTTTTESTTTTSTQSTTTTTTSFVEAGSAWGEGTDYGTGNAQYFILPDGQTLITVDLVLGATHIDIGDVTAIRTGNTLSVTFTTVFSYVMQEVQVEVSNNSVPSTSNPGQFTYKHSVADPSEYFTTYTFTNIDVTGFTNIYIAAHAKIFQ